MKPNRLPEGRVGLAGSLLMATGLLVTPVPWATVLLLGVGSATLHIAAGTATLKLPRRGLAVGVFESTGAIGLAAGTVLGSGARLTSGWVWSGLFAVIVLLGGLVILWWGTAGVARLGTGEAVKEGFGLSARLDDTMVGCPRPRRPAWTLADAQSLAPIAILTVLTVLSLMRSVVGFSAPQPWKDTTVLVMCAAVAVALGRAIGGVIADRWGAFMPSLFGFVGVALCWGLAPQFAWAGLLGAFCMALPMAPIILALVTVTRRPSLSFGLAQLFQVPAALTAGFLLTPWAVLAVLLTGAVLVLAMRPLDDRKDLP